MTSTILSRSVPSRAVTALLISTLACADRDGAASGDSAAATPSPAADSRPARRVEILSPANGDTVGPDFRVALGATGVTIELANNLHEDGRGHHHLFLNADVTGPDVAIPPNAPATPPVTAQIVHIGTGASEHTFTGVAPGPHRIIAVIAYGDHKPMAGTATDTVNVVVRRP